MPSGGARPNSGPKKGAKYAPTISKELAREALRQVVLVQVVNVFQMRSKRLFHGDWQHRSPILVALALADHDLVAGEVNILHSETQTLQQPQAGPVSEAGHDPAHVCLLGPHAYVPRPYRLPNLVEQLGLSPVGAFSNRSFAHLHPSHGIGRLESQTETRPARQPLSRTCL